MCSDSDESEEEAITPTRLSQLDTPVPKTDGLDVRCSAFADCLEFSHWLGAGGLSAEVLSTKL